MTRQDIECWLFGLVLAFVLQKRGVFSLHGAAVQCFDWAVGFLGSNGFGKSTLAFLFPAAGAPTGDRRCSGTGGEGGEV